MSEEHYMPPGPHAFESYVHRVNKTQFAMPVLSIFDKLEYIFATAEGLESKVTGWIDFNREYEPSADVTEKLLDIFDEGNNTARATELIVRLIDRKENRL